MPFQGVAFATGSAYSAVASAAPVPSPSQSAGSSSRNNKLSELQQFLLDIDLTIAAYFQFFDDEVLSLNAPVHQLLDLDAGAVFNVFHDIQGLPLFLVATATDGVRKAKERQAKNPPGAKLDPRLATGLPWATADRYVKWTHRKRNGKPILVQEEAAPALAAL